MSKALLQQASLGSWGNSNLPLPLSLEEERKLFEELERNPENKEVREEIINRNRRLVKSCANKVKNSHSTNGLTFEDLCQEGMIGLMEAVGKFDFSRKYKFSTCAINWIKRAMTMVIQNEAKMIRIPTTEARIINEYKTAEGNLFSELKRFPFPEEIAEKMGVKLTKVKFLEKIDKDTISLDSFKNSFLENDNGGTLMDTIIDGKAVSPSSSAERKNLKEEIIKALSCYLTVRERKILVMRFLAKNGEGYTLKEVGRILGGFTKERIRQIQVLAFKKLEERSPELRELLE